MRALKLHIKRIFEDFEKERPSARRSVSRKLYCPPVGLPDFRSYMDVLKWIKTNTQNAKGTALTFEFEGEEVKISTHGKAYYSKRAGAPDLSFEENTAFMKLLYNFKHLILDAQKG